LGFTLVELLVVVAIIAMLLVLLVPSLRSTIELVRDMQCKSNLHTLSQALNSPQGGLPTADKWLKAVSQAGAEAALDCPKAIRRGGGRGQPTSIADVTGFIRIQETAPPGLPRHPRYAYIFPEKQQVTLQADLPVNIVSPGCFTPPRDARGYATDHPSATIPAGTQVDSYYISFSYLNTEGTYMEHATVTFFGKILGYATDNDYYAVRELSETMKVVGLPNTEYSGGSPYPHRWGIESVMEAVEMSEDRHTLKLGPWGVGMAPDCIRVILESYSGGEARTDYGMNDQVPGGVGARQGQVLLVGYDRSVIDPDGMHQDILNNIVDEERLRHFGKMNALFVDGSVRGLTPQELHKDAGIWKP